MPISRRTVLKGLGAAGAIPLLGSSPDAVEDAPPPRRGAAGRAHRHSHRRPDHPGQRDPDGGWPSRADPGRRLAGPARTGAPPLVRLTGPGPDPVDLARREWRLSISGDPLAIRVEAPDGRLIQQIRINADTGGVHVSPGRRARCWASAKEARSSIAAARSIGCGAAREDIACGRTAAACPSPG